LLEAISAELCQTMTMRIFVVTALTLSFSGSSFAANTSYSDVQNFIDTLTRSHANNTRKISIGQSDSGEIISALQIGNGPIKNIVVATHHGNEYGSTEVAMAFAKSLAKKPIRGQTIFVVPVLNISGYNKRNRYEEANGNFHDPNRDYPGPCATEGPFLLKSTKALADFIEKENIVASATLHTYYPAVVYPWGISSHDLTTPYLTQFTKLVKDATIKSKYQVGNSTEIIYPADGTYEDFAYWKHGIWSILFELGFSHSPSDNEIKTTIAKNIPGLRRMLENAPPQRASKHDFSGQCDLRLQSLDRHDE
jgi:carboxypeptidase T